MKSKWNLNCVRVVVPFQVNSKWNLLEELQSYLVYWNKTDVFWMKRFVPATLHKFNKIRRSFSYRPIAPLYIVFLFLLWYLLLMRRRRFSTSISHFLMYAKSFNRKQLLTFWTRIFFIMRIHLVSFQTLLCKLKRYVANITRNFHAHFSFKQDFQ